MNRFFKTLWNHSKSAWVCVSERSRNISRSRSSQSSSHGQFDPSHALPRLRPLTVALGLAMGLSLASPATAAQPCSRADTTVCFDAHQHLVFDSPTTPYVMSGKTQVVSDMQIEGTLNVEGTLVLEGVESPFGDQLHGIFYQAVDTTSQLTGRLTLESGAQLVLLNTLGSLYREASDPTPITYATPFKIATSGGSSLASMTLAAPADLGSRVFDLTALNQYALTPTQQPIRTLVAASDLNVVNTYSSALSPENTLTLTLSALAPTRLVTVNLQSEQRPQPSYTLSGTGVVTFENGDTLNVSALNAVSEGSTEHLTFALNRNAVLLGDTSSFADTQAIGTTDLLTLFSDAKPYWVDTLDLANVNVATLATVSQPLSATRLNTLHGLWVQQGTTTIDGSAGSITAPITVLGDGVLTLTGNAHLSTLTSEGGTIHFSAGTTTVDTLNTTGAVPSTWVFDDGATLTLTNDPGTLRVNPIETASTDAAVLASLLQFNPSEFLTTGVVSETPTAIAHYDTTSGTAPILWSIGASGAISGLPFKAHVLPEKTVSFSTTAPQQQTLLFNEGHVTLENASVSLFFYVGTPTSHLTLRNTTFGNVGGFSGIPEDNPIWFDLPNLNALEIGENVRWVNNQSRDPYPISIHLTALTGAAPNWFTRETLDNLHVGITMLRVDEMDDTFTWKATPEADTTLGWSDLPVDVLVVDRARLSTLPITELYSVIKDLTLTHSTTLDGTWVAHNLTLEPNVTLTLHEMLGIQSGSTLTLNDGATIVNQVRGYQTSPVIKFPLGGFSGDEAHTLTVSVKDFAQWRAVASLFGTGASDTLTVVTRDALTNVTAEDFTHLTRWTLNGNVNGITSSTLPIATVVNAGATLTQPGALTVERGLTIAGTVSVEDLTVGEAVSELMGSGPASVITVLNGGTLEIRGHLTLNPTESTGVLVREGGVIKTDLPNLVTSYQTLGHSTTAPAVNYVLESDRRDVTQQGTWVPSFAEPSEEGWSVYDLRSIDTPLINQVLERLGTIALTQPHSRLIVSENLKSNLIVGEGNEVEFIGNAIAPNLVMEGSRLELQRGARLVLDKVADLSGPLSGAMTLVLHPESQIVVGEPLQGKLTSGEEAYALQLRHNLTLETEASTLNRDVVGSPAWWALINDDIAQYDTLASNTSHRTLVTTGTTRDINPEQFSRWEVAGPGENQTAHLAEDTVVRYGKTLTLTMERLVTGDSLVFTDAKAQTITNLGTVRFDDLTLINAGTSAIMGGGAVEKVGSGTATIDGTMGYVGHTTVKEGTLKLRQESDLTGNVTVKGGATLYASNEVRETLERTPSNVTRLVRSLRVASAVSAATPTAATPSHSNSLHFDAGSTFRVDLNAATYATHQTRGDVTIGAGVKLVVNLDPAMTLTLGTTLDNVLTWGGTLTGRFTGAANEANTPLIAYELTDNPNFDLQALYDEATKSMSLVVVANQVHTDDPAPQPEPEPEPEPEPTPPGTDPVTPQEPTPTTPERAGEQPLLSGTGKLALANFAHDAQRAKTERTVICGDNGHALWASLLGGRGHLAGDGSTLGYTAEHTGVAVGTELCAGQTRGGMMLAAGHSEANDRDAALKHDLTANTWLVGLYGERDLTDRVTLEANLGIGRSRVKGERQLVTEGLTAKSRTHASLYQAGVRLSWQATELLKPFARLDYTRVTMKGFTENGANAHNQHVSRDTYDELIARVGAQITTPLTSRLRVSARVSAGVDLLDGLGTTHARFVDGTGEVAVKNGARSRVLGDVALGLAYQVTPTWTLSTSVTGEARRHQREGALDLRSTWTF